MIAPSHLHSFFSKGGVSYAEPLGHVDFYPSGGEHQAGCDKVCVGDHCTGSYIIIMDLLKGKLDFSKINEFSFYLFKGGCSHQRANDYFSESINGAVDFTAKLCKNNESYLNGECVDATAANMGLYLDIGK